MPLENSYRGCAYRKQRQWDSCCSGDSYRSSPMAADMQEQAEYTSLTVQTTVSGCSTRKATCCKMHPNHPWLSHLRCLLKTGRSNNHPPPVSGKQCGLYPSPCEEFSTSLTVPSSKRLEFGHKNSTQEWHLAETVIPA